MPQLTRQQVGVEMNLSVSTTAVSLTVPADANHALIAIETAAIRFRDDGTDPDATTGIPLPVDSYLAWLEPDVLYGQRLRNFRAIRSGGNNASLSIIYYR